jgi:hypothetical protein
MLLRRNAEMHPGVMKRTGKKQGPGVRGLGARKGRAEGRRQKAKEKANPKSRSCFCLSLAPGPWSLAPCYSARYGSRAGIRRCTQEAAGSGLFNICSAACASSCRPGRPLRPPRKEGRWRGTIPRSPHRSARPRLRGNLPCLAAGRFFLPLYLSSALRFSYRALPISADRLIAGSEPARARSSMHGHEVRMRRAPWRAISRKGSTTSCGRSC